MKDLPRESISGKVNLNLGQVEKDWEWKELAFLCKRNHRSKDLAAQNYVYFDCNKKNVYIH